MSQKPDNICKLRKDKFVGGQDGFVDTFNWMGSFIDALQGDYDFYKEADKTKFITVDTEVTDKPVIKMRDGFGKIEGVGSDGAITYGVGFPVSLQSGDNSNVQYTVSQNDNGGLVIKTDVFYV